MLPQQSAALNRTLAGIRKKDKVVLRKGPLRSKYKVEKIGRNVLRDISLRLPKGITPESVSIISHRDAIILFKPKKVPTLGELI